MEQCLEDILLCDFVSLDLEFSGLYNGVKKTSQLDEHYAHCSDSVSKFLALQLGVCCARFVHEDDKSSLSNKAEREGAVSGDGQWLLSAYNFNVFPRSRRVISNIDTNCLQFLQEQGFDLNEWVRKGYDYDRLSNVDCPYMRTQPQILKSGLQRIIQHIVENERPVIVHNGFLDLLHVFDKFISPIPASVEEFATECQRLFSGGIYDTKRIANEARIHSSHRGGHQMSANKRRKQNASDEGIAKYVNAFEVSDGVAVTEVESEPSAEKTYDDATVATQISSPVPGCIPPSSASEPTSSAKRSPKTSIRWTTKTSLDALRLDLRAQCCDRLRLKIIPNDTCSYQLHTEARLAPEASLSGKRSQPGGKPVQSDGKDHEAGYDALLTMHLFLLEAEALQSADDPQPTPESILSSSAIREARDKLDTPGVCPGFIDLDDKRSKIRDRMSKDSPTPTPTGEEILSAPLFQSGSS